jgi:hypothetical protein
MMALLGPSVTRANGTLMARGRLSGFSGPGARDQREPLTWDFVVERVTGIEPALSAWETDRSGPLTALSWAVDAPRVTVRPESASKRVTRFANADRCRSDLG